MTASSGNTEYTFPYKERINSQYPSRLKSWIGCPASQESIRGMAQSLRKRKIETSSDCDLFPTLFSSCAEKLPPNKFLSVSLLRPPSVMSLFP